MNTRFTPTLAALCMASAASAQTASAAKLPPFLTDAKLSATIEANHTGTMTLTLTPLKGYHLYAPNPGDKFLTPTTIKLPLVRGLKFGAPTWPASKKLGKANVYDGPVTVVWKLAAGEMLAKNAPLTLTIKAQGCNENDCFPPATFTLTAKLPPAK